MKKIVFMLSIIALFVLSCGGKNTATPNNGDTKKDSSDVIKIGFIVKFYNRPYFSLR